jgi:uncharacterized membrane protein YoaK (UPF0700 family)
VKGRPGRFDPAIAFAVALAAIAGWVDAIGFTRLFAVFPANQSGNAVLLGIGIGDADGDDLLRPAIAIAGFVVGVVVGLALQRHAPAHRRAPALLGAEAALLAGLAVAAGALPERPAAFSGGREVLALVLASIAMGLQTDVIRRAAGVTLVTTYQTGAIDRLALGSAETAFGDRVPGAGPHPLAVLGLVVTAYVGGAAAGVAVADQWDRGLWVPSAAALVLALLALGRASAARIDDDRS